MARLIRLADLLSSDRKSVLGFACLNSTISWYTLGTFSMGATYTLPHFHGCHVHNCTFIADEWGQTLDFETLDASRYGLGLTPRNCVNVNVAP